MATASSMILRGLQLIGEKPLGYTLTADENSTWLAVLNAMMESWSLDSLMLYQEVQENFALTANVGAYTIGSGGDFSTTRPTNIITAFARDSANVDYPIEIINDAAYNNIRLKSTTGTYPSHLYYDQAYIAGLATIKIYPLPSSGLTLYISSLKQLTQFGSIGETVVLPPGYQRAIESNFAIEAAAGQVPITRELAQIAKESKSALKNMNAPSPTLKIEFAGGGRSNIFAG